MSLREKQLISAGIAVAGVFILVLAKRVGEYENIVVMLACIAAASGLALNFKWVRCPYCGSRIGWGTRDRCKTCDKHLNWTAKRGKK